MIQTAKAIYTGGNIWLFYGELKDGTFFLTDDFGATLILDESPENLDESLYDEWQTAHTVRELTDESERSKFCLSLLNWLKATGTGRNCGMTDLEIEGYKKYMCDPN